MSDAAGVAVLFVCLGNICRSPMAEGVFRSLAVSHPRISTIDSAGTGAYHTSEPPDSRTLDTLRRHGITGFTHGARKITSQDFKDFDYIFAMDGSNLDSLQRTHRMADRSGKSKAKVMLFGEFGGKMGRAEEVADPYYGAENGFEVVFEQVSRFAKNFLKSLEEKM